MSQLFVPERPTTQQLREKYPQTPEEREAIAAMRRRVSDIFGALSTELLVTVGPCAMTAEEVALRQEARQMAELTCNPSSHAIGLIREPDFKPRSDPAAWHGLITSDPETAYRILRNTSGEFANVAIEIGTDPEHLVRNAPFTTLAWKGGRNDDEPELTERLALHDPMLPIAVKNGLDGDLEKAVAEVNKIEELRGHIGARAILLFRGGTNAQTPVAWEAQYLLAHDMTEGRLIVDFHHHTGTAHDPNGEKSIEGPDKAMNHLMDIGERTGKYPVGTFSEASNTWSPTDPVMSPSKAITKAMQLANQKQSLLV